MYIQTKQRHSRNETMFVFCFKDEKDSKSFFSVLSAILENVNGDEEVMQRAQETLRKLQSRTDDMYVRKDVALSGNLFDDEMVELFYGMLSALLSTTLLLTEKVEEE